MGDTSELVLLCGGATLINVTYAAKHKHKLEGPLVASGAQFLALAFLGGVWREDVAVAIAGLIFFAALIIRGLPLAEDLSDVGKTGWSGGGGSF